MYKELSKTQIFGFRLYTYTLIDPKIVITPFPY